MNWDGLLLKFKNKIRKDDPCMLAHIFSNARSLLQGLSTYQKDMAKSLKDQDLDENIRLLGSTRCTSTS